MRILSQSYDMTIHAMEEMAEDDLDILDIEEAILNGEIVHSTKRDLRGTKFTIEGIALDGETPVGIVGRFHSNDRSLIITVYEVSTYH